MTSRSRDEERLRRRTADRSSGAESERAAPEAAVVPAAAPRRTRPSRGLEAALLAASVPAWLELRPDIGCLAAGDEDEHVRAAAATALAVLDRRASGHGHPST